MATHFKGPVFSATNVCKSLAAVVTAAGTTTLDINAAGIQNFTGSTTQTVLMPPAYLAGAQLPVGYEIVIMNSSSGTVTVQDSAAGAIGTVAGGAKKSVVCTANSTAAGTWIII